MSTEKQTLNERLKKPVKQWIKAIVWNLLYILFIVWVGNFWWLLLMPLIFDAFVTEFIPWTWWKKSENKAFLAVMSWVDAIVFALVAVYFINNFFFQNYQIPTSSLEKTLLVGDFLFVSKATYGPRVPNTPLSMPLMQHTVPVLGTKSFIENPQWEYKRLKGLTSIKRNDIVVFNFPTGDTVAVKKENPDYYTSCYYEGYSLLKQRNPGIEPSAEECFSKGREIVKANPQEYGKIIYRPVDRRENYVKRCVAIPGDRLEIVDNKVFINGEPQIDIPGIQFNYYVQTNGTLFNDSHRESLGVSKDDWHYLGMNGEYPVYFFPLTEEALNKLKTWKFVEHVQIETSHPEEKYFPLGGGKNWTRENFGPIYIPKKGAVLRLNAYNLPIYERIIRVYENNKMEVRDGNIYINDEATETYTFKMDYYWMMGDNRHNSADSRSWGFVPEDHIVGRPVVVWLSLNKDKSGLGKIRWDRFFKSAIQ